MKKYRFLFCAVIFSLFSAFAFSQGLTNEGGSSQPDAVTAQSERLAEEGALLGASDSVSGSSDSETLSTQVLYSRIIDQAGLLSQEDLDILTDEGLLIEKKYSFPLYVAIVSDFKSSGLENIEDFAEYFFEQNNLGMGEEKTGLLLVLSMAERDYDIMAHGERGHYAFTDFGKDKLADRFKPYFREDDWYGGLEAYYYLIDYMLSTADEGYPVDVDNWEEPEEPKEPKDWFIAELVIFAIAMIITLISVGVETSKLNNVSLADDAEDYIRSEDVRITHRDSKFIRETRSVTHIDKGSSGGGTSVNSRGYSHSSGKF